MRILFLGDVFGKNAREAVVRRLPEMVEEERIDFTIVNAENAAGGSGVTPATAEELLACSDLLTSGNHIWSKRGVEILLDAPGSKVLRPLNYPAPSPGRGVAVLEKGGLRLGVINLEGRIFMKPLDDPFRIAEQAVEELRSKGIRSIFIDFHAEATSEKWALAHHLDGKVSAVVGTHTHVQTADERLLPKGTAFLTDAGMCGPIHSIIGVKVEQALGRTLNQRPTRFEPAEGPVWIQGAVVEVDSESGRALAIRRIQERLGD